MKRAQIGTLRSTCQSYIEPELRMKIVPDLAQMSDKEPWFTSGIENDALREYHRQNFKRRLKVGISSSLVKTSSIS